MTTMDSDNQFWSIMTNSWSTQKLWSFHITMYLVRHRHRASELLWYFSDLSMTSVFCCDGIYSLMYQQVCRRRSRGNRGRLLPYLHLGWKQGLIWCLIWDLDSHGTAWRLSAFYIFAAQVDRKRGCLCYRWGRGGICLWRSGGGRLGRWGLGVKVRVAMIWRVRDGDGGQFEGRHFPLLGLCIRGNAAVVNISRYSELLWLLDEVCTAFRVGIRSLAA